VLTGHGAAIDTTTSSGKLVFGIFTALAEFERELISTKRTTARSCGTSLRVRDSRAHRPDLILMDIQLPIVDGYEATRQIKAQEQLCAIPIIAVTSYALSGDEEKAKLAGCDAYLTKPFNP
jgi:CheY-like chemotaxis protein